MTKNLWSYFSPRKTVFKNESNSGHYQAVHYLLIVLIPLLDRLVANNLRILWPERRCLKEKMGLDDSLHVLWRARHLITYLPPPNGKESRQEPDVAVTSGHVLQKNEPQAANERDIIRQRHSNGGPRVTSGPPRDMKWPAKISVR